MSSGDEVTPVSSLKEGLGNQIAEAALRMVARAV